MIMEHLRFESTNVFAKIDPRLQRILERRSRGLTSPASASTEAGEVAVIARVTDVSEWRAMSEVHEGAYLGEGPKFSGHIVTARVPLSRVENVRSASPVMSLKHAQPLRPMLDATIEEIGARRDLLPESVQGDQGDGVIVGIVDYGCDFAHENFRHPDGTTRLLSIWDQQGPSRSDSPFGYGRLYDRAEIDTALQAAHPYAVLGYGPAPDTPWEKGTHGTHVMDIAAGNGRGTGIPGVAPRADLAFVHVSSSDIPRAGEEVIQASFGDSVQLLEAIAHIFNLAGDRPCVVNVSLGTNGGPHDGSTLVEQGIDALSTGAPNRAVVIAASNSYDDGIHASGTVPQGGFVDLRWNIPVSDWTHNELEVWYGADDQFQIELLLPDLTSLGTVDLGQNGRLTDNQGNTLIFVAHRQRDPNNGDNAIGVYLEKGLPGGAWTMRLHGVQVRDGSFHAWIERDDLCQSNFAPPHDNSHTIGSISCGHASIATGSYDAHKLALPLSWFSSAGPTRDGRQKPEISAPGHGVWAAHSRTGQSAIRKSGTSMAAPAVTGVTALMLAEARAQSLSLTVDQAREILADTARHDPPDPSGGWHDRYGYGRVDARAAVSRVR